MNLCQCSNVFELSCTIFKLVWVFGNPVIKTVYVLILCISSVQQISWRVFNFCLASSVMKSYSGESLGANAKGMLSWICWLKINHRTDSSETMFLDSVGALLFFLNSKASQFQINNSNVGG